MSEAAKQKADAIEQAEAELSPTRLRSLPMPFGFERIPPELRTALEGLERMHEDQVLVPFVAHTSAQEAGNALPEALRRSAEFQVAFAAMLMVHKNATLLALDEVSRRSPARPLLFQGDEAQRLLQPEVALLFDAALDARWKLANLLLRRPDLLVSLVESGRIQQIGVQVLEADFALSAARTALVRSIEVVAGVGHLLGELALVRAREAYGVAAAPMYEALDRGDVDGSDVG